MRRGALGWLVPLVIGAFGASACGATKESAPAAPSSQPTTASSAAPSVSESAAPESEPSPSLPAVTNPLSLPALMGETFTGSPIRRVRQLLSNDSYVSHEIRYRSGKLTISGVLNVPRGAGPFPAVVLNHGHIERDIYVNGQGMTRERDVLARAGFVVLHTDYRGHGPSQDTNELDHTLRLGYTRDAINAGLALKQEPSVDPDRVAAVGRSMGGAVTMNALVAQPEVFAAGVVFASTSSAYLDNFNRWVVTERPAAARAVYDRFGRPGQAKGFYAGLSARTYFDRLAVPLLALHGTADDTCPIRWAYDTKRLLDDAGKPNQLQIYDGEQHAFGPRFPDAMDRTIRFLRRQLA